MKAVAAGVPDATLMKMLRKNTRVPDQVLGDLHAQFAALDLMERRVLGLLAEHELPDLAGPRGGDPVALGTRDARGDRGGAGRGVSRRGADGRAGPAAEAAARSSPISGDEIVADYAGSDPQVARAINVCLVYTFAYTAFAVKAALCPAVPNNEGSFRPLTVTAPEGCILNSTHPAAGGARALTGHFLPALVMSALADALPDRVVAGVGSPLVVPGLFRFPQGRQAHRQCALPQWRLWRQLRHGRRQCAELAVQRLLRLGRDHRADGALAHPLPPPARGHGRRGRAIAAARGRRRSTRAVPTSPSP
jgi:hypothetical protein